MSVSEFLGHFYPDADEPIWLRSFTAKGVPENLRRGAQNIEVTRDRLQKDRDLQHRLKEINKTQGIYFVVNAGGNSDAEITRINAIFCEMDDKPLIQQHDIYENESPWCPSLRVETKKSVHAYWLLSEPIQKENFLELQQGLIAFYKSDVSIKNLARVMRVPYFNHVSYDDGFKYKRIEVADVRPDKYSLAELREGFPYRPTVEHIQRWSGPIQMETLENVKAECRRRIMALKSWRPHGEWGSAQGVCHGGEGKTALRINLASGHISCWQDCSFQTILAAFGLEIPRREKGRFDYVPKRPQTSALAEWLQTKKKEKYGDLL